MISLRVITLSVLAALTGQALGGCRAPGDGRGEPAVRVGILHSLSGIMAVSEAPVADATRMAIDELNAAGGVLGRRIEALVVDGQSDPRRFAEAAERLIAIDGAKALFGCWTSVSRKAVKEVVERHRHLLVYPLRYEGMEDSPNILYTGLAPNQQIIPAVSWAARNLGRRFYLVGSDYVFPRTANLIVREYAAPLGASILAERYLPLGNRDTRGVVEEIARLRPDVVVNTFNGDTSYAFFEALATLAPASVPKVLSFTLAEAEFARAPRSMSGHYAAWSYFQTLDSPENRTFVEAFRRRYGAARPVSDPMVAAYLGVRLWANAVERAGSFEPAKVNRTLAGQSLRSPMGIVSVDAHSRHVWRALRIGRARPDGQFDVVWTSDGAIRPMPFPLVHTPSEWNALLRSGPKLEGR